MEAKWDGFTYLVEDSDYQWHINNGLNEPYTRELDIVKAYLSRFPTCNNTYIDIGAHIGTTCLPYSRLFKEVHAFEPNTISYYLLKMNIEINNIENIKHYNMAIYNKKKTCTILKHSENTGCYYIKESDEIEGSIPMVKLDDMIYDNPIDFIKIDTEGSELFVLEGAHDLILKNKPLINIETNNCSDKYFGYNKERIFEFLKSLDYKILDDDGNNPLFYCK
jgi:FkbM family methyltransferase